MRRFIWFWGVYDLTGVYTIEPWLLCEVLSTVLIDFKDYRHFPTDVIGGALIGIITTTLCFVQYFRLDFLYRPDQRAVSQPVNGHEFPPNGTNSTRDIPSDQTRAVSLWSVLLLLAIHNFYFIIIVWKILWILWFIIPNSYHLSYWGIPRPRLTLYFMFYCSMAVICSQHNALLNKNLP